MNKLLMKMAIVAAILVPLIWAVPGQTETITVGNEPIGRAYLDPAFYFSGFTYSNIAVVDYMKPIPRNGKVTGFQYYAANTNPFYFMLLDDSFIVQWLSEKITPQGTSVNVHSLTSTSYVPVQSGWMIGVYLMSDGTIPFDFNLPGGSGTVYLYNSSLPTVDSPFAYEGISNRTYSFAATVEIDKPKPGQSVDVTIVKYLDGTHAGAVSASGNSFPLLASWGDPKDPTSGGSDYFYLGPSGVNTENSYEAKSPVIPVGSFFSVAEDTSQGAVGKKCANGQFSRLLGYTTGDKLNLAEKAKRTTAPSLTNIVSNKYVIVWNETCKYVNVTVVKYLDGKHASATSAQSNSFPMNASWSAANGSGSAAFDLGPTVFNTVNPYEAQSLLMTSGATYSVSEDTSKSAVGKTCANGQFSQLLGYTTGGSLEEAVANIAKINKKAPALNSIVSNQYVIVWNETCGTDDDDECDNDDNGHHYGNDKGDDHHKCKHGDNHHKCKHDDNGHHYGNDKGDQHESPKDKDDDKKGKDGGKR